MSLPRATQSRPGLVRHRASSTARGVQAQAARLFRVSEKSRWYRIEKFGIQPRVATAASAPSPAVLA